MKRCRSIRKYFPEALYDELSVSDKNRFEAHLWTCGDCTTEFEGFKRTIEVMNRREQPIPDETYWNGYWDSLTERMETRPAPGHLGLPKWAWQTAAALLLVFIGFTLGRLFDSNRTAGRPSGTIMAEGQGGMSSDEGMIRRANHYIDRSNIILLALQNDDPEGDAYALSLPEQKRVSQELIHEASALKVGLGNSRQKNLRELVEELEIILLQIANLDLEQNQGAVDILRDGVASQGILMKINLFKIRQEAAKSDSRSSGNASGFSKLI
ncbi:MAG: zf-HC2 domain-containing protein [Acidobacteriota bacterium]